MDKPKVNRGSVKAIADLMNQGNDPTSKKIRKIKKEAQKNVIKMFSVDGKKKEDQ